MKMEISSDRSILAEGVTLYKNDHNVDKIAFTLPRFWGDDDLKDDEIRVVYQRADGYTDYYTPSDVTVDESDDSLLHFTWLVSQNVTKTEGALLMSVCAKEQDVDGDTTYHWSSRTARVSVVDTLDCGSVLDIMGDAEKTEFFNILALVDSINVEVI